MYQHVPTKNPLKTHLYTWVEIWSSDTNPKDGFRNDVTIFDDFWKCIPNFASLDLKAQKELERLVWCFGKFRVWTCFFLWVTCEGSWLLFQPQQQHDETVFRNFQNVTNFDVVDISHQKHADDFPELFRNYPLYIFVLWVCFCVLFKKIFTTKKSGNPISWDCTELRKGNFTHHTVHFKDNSRHF